MWWEHLESGSERRQPGEGVGAGSHRPLRVLLRTIDFILMAKGGLGRFLSRKVT